MNEETYILAAIELSNFVESRFFFKIIIFILIFRKDSANQTNFGEKLSDIVSTSVTKGRPKLSSGEKQPLVAVKSLITEENEEEVEMRDGKRIEDEDALQLKNPLYDVVKDLRYSSSEDNMSSGHEEMVCPEGDYAYPEDVFENQHEEGNRKSDAGCPTYDEIGDQIVPSGKKHILACLYFIGHLCS